MSDSLISPPKISPSPTAAELARAKKELLAKIAKNGEKFWPRSCSPPASTDSSTPDFERALLAKLNEACAKRDANAYVEAGIAAEGAKSQTCHFGATSYRESFEQIDANTCEPMRPRLSGCRAFVGLVIACVAVAAGCVSTTFEPYSAAQHYPEAKIAMAIRIYEGDLATLAHANAHIVGKMTLEGKGVGVDDPETAHRVAKEAREYGGTHFFLTDSRVDRYFTSSGNIITGQQGPFISHADYQATYVILRVEPDRWHELPKELQPEDWR